VPKRPPAAAEIAALLGARPSSTRPVRPSLVGDVDEETIGESLTGQSFCGTFPGLKTTREIALARVMSWANCRDSPAQPRETRLCARTRGKSSREDMADRPEVPAWAPWAVRVFRGEDLQDAFDCRRRRPKIGHAMVFRAG